MQIKNRVMVLLRTGDYDKLVEQGKRASETGESTPPVVKLFMENVTWLVTEIDDQGILSGWADLGLGLVEWGSLCHVDELPTLRGRIAWMERDRHWKHKEGTDYGSRHTLIGI